MQRQMLWNAGSKSLLKYRTAILKWRYWNGKRRYWNSKYSHPVQGHQSQMQNSIKLLKIKKLTFMEKWKYLHVGNSLTFVNKSTNVLWKLTLTIRKTFTFFLKIPQMTLLIVTSKLFELERCATSQIVWNWIVIHDFSG